MRPLKLNRCPKVLLLRVRHPIAPMQLLLKLLSTLDRVVMQADAPPGDGFPPRRAGDLVAIFAHRDGPGTRGEPVGVHRRPGFGRLDNRFDVAVVRAFPVVRLVVVNARREALPR